MENDKRISEADQIMEVVKEKIKAKEYYKLDSSEKVAQVKVAQAMLKNFKVMKSLDKIKIKYEKEKLKNPDLYIACMED